MINDILTNPDNSATTAITDSKGDSNVSEVSRYTPPK